jgi:hypothetical protein
MLSFREGLRGKYSNPKAWKLEILCLIVIILFASGTGLFLYCIYWFYKLHLFRKKGNVLLFILLVVIIIRLMIYAADHSDGIISRMSYKNIGFLWDFKAKQLENAIIGMKKSSVLIGAVFTRENILIWNDFALHDLFYSLGISGIAILFLFSINKINAINAAAVLISLLGMLHYGAIISMPGQLIFAYALLLNKKNAQHW